MEVRNLCKAYGDNAVLTNFSAVFPEGETTCIMGQSGCGKTTLLRVLLGLTGKDDGEILKLPEKPAVVFQEDRLCPTLSVMTNIRLVTGKTVPEATILSHLTRLGLRDFAETAAQALSGGMARRAAIARAVLCDGDCVILDEPFKGLDEETKQTVMTYVREETKGKTVLLVTHDEAEAAFFDADIVKMETACG